MIKEQVPAPWTPVQVKKENQGYSLSVWGRSYRVEPHAVLFSSVVSQDTELLSRPMELTASENGQDAVWTDYEAFILERQEDRVTLCCSAQSRAFIVNTTIAVEYDGFAQVDLKIMPRGHLVPQLFGVMKAETPETRLDRLWIDIPMRTETASLYHVYPASSSPSVELENAGLSGSGELPQEDWAMPFKATLFVGNERLGLSWLAQSAQGWQPAEEGKAVEILRRGDTTVLRMHLLDSPPLEWQKTGSSEGQYLYPPVSFRFAFQAAPVKPFPANPYKKWMHLDCFKKIEGDYYDFLSKPVPGKAGENGFDRLKRLGVTGLVLHEKWNKIQNYWKLAEPTEEQLANIIRECHARGIKVIPYFGYELSTMSDIWQDRAHEMLRYKENDNKGKGWYREPWQRSYAVCYNSSIQDEFVQGIQALVKKFSFDGIYLDGTAMIWECKNTSHGCGYTARDGQLKATYPVFAVRSLMKKLRAVMQEAGGVIDCHTSDCFSLAGLSHADSLWLGEYIQYKLVREGAEEMPGAYMRAGLTGRNFGIPTEFITYENPPVWTFEQALAFALIHGVLPRPNDIDGPLELMSGIWGILDRFPIENASWHPYWETGNAIRSCHECVKVSYYHCRETDEYLVFCTNSAAGPLEKAELDFTDTGRSRIEDGITGESITLENGRLTLSFKKFGYTIWRL